MSAKLRVAAIISFLLVLGGMILLVAQPGLDPARLQPLAPVGGAWIAFGCAAWLLRKVTLKLAVGLSSPAAVIPATSTTAALDARRSPPTICATWERWTSR